MDFIVGLPKSINKSVVMVVKYCLLKYSHLCSLQHPFIASRVAPIFMDDIFKLHGMPHSIVFDRDPNFTQKFCKELFRLREPNCISTFPIIPRLMDKVNLSTSVWKYICIVLRMIDKINGPSGYP
jgi:hypothetical protein